MVPHTPETAAALEVHNRVMAEYDAGFRALAESSLSPDGDPLWIEVATPEHLSVIRTVYADARAIQRAQDGACWPEFPDAAILAEVAAGHLYRVLDGEVLAGVFSVAYEDPAIWGELERGAHVYLHRIARAAAYSGRGLLDVVLGWARAHVRALGREGLRMDTWASNTALIAYYERRGFRLVGRRRLTADPRLLPHYHGLELALLEESPGGGPTTGTR